MSAFDPDCECLPWGLCFVCEHSARLRAEPPFTCKARQGHADPPQDCDWPMCGCDPYADKVIAALQEAGKLEPLTIVHRFAIDICEDCLALRGESCNNADCVFCGRAMIEVRELLDILSIMP